MKKALRFGLKDLRQVISKLVAIMLIVMLGVGFLIGLLTTAPNMRYSVEHYYTKNNVADLVVQSPAPIMDEEIETLEAHPEVTGVMPYFMIDEVIEIDDADRMAKIMLLDFTKELPINRLELIEGRLPNPDADHFEVVVEQTQSFLIDIPIGYQTEALGQTFEVVGIVQHPWYFAYVQEYSLEMHMPIETIIYVDRSFFETDVYTHLAVTLKNPKHHNIFSDEYKTYVEGVVTNLEDTYNDTFYYHTRNQNQSYVKFQNDVKIVEIIALIFPVFFFLVAILVSMSSMTKIVADQRIQIGTMRSLGFSKMRILWKYIFYALLSSGVGSILGIGLGIYLIPAVIYNAYLNSYNLPKLRIEYHFFYISLISLLMIAAVVLVAIFSVITTLNEKPAALLRLKPPKSGRKVFLERWGAFWKRIRFSTKLTIRNIFRNRRNSVLTLLGVAGSTALLLAGFGIKNSVEFSGDFQYETMQNYDFEVSVLPGQTALTPLETYTKTTLLNTNAQIQNAAHINVLIPADSEEINDYLHFKNKQGKDLDFNHDSLMITQQFAKQHHLNTGDEITIKFADLTKAFTITDILQFHFGNHLYLSKDLLPEDYSLNFNQILVKADLTPEETKTLREELEELPEVIQVSFEEDLKLIFKKTSESINSIIIVLVASASLLAIVINYNITMINIATRQKEIATLKVLGYSEKEVASYVFRETLVVSIIAILLGSLLGYFLHWFMMSRIFLDGVMFAIHISWWAYLLTLGLSLFFLLIVFIILAPRMRKIDLVEALKSFE